MERAELWGKRPMEVDMIRYAAADVAVQMPLHLAIMERLADKTVQVLFVLICCESVCLCYFVTD